MYPYKCCRSPQRTVAAALSAAVTRTKLIGAYTHLTGGTKQEEMYRPKRLPLFGREREGGASLREAASLAYLAHFPPLFGRERREGKDSHSRQWRLSMAVFLNRNKQP